MYRRLLLFRFILPAGCDAFKLTLIPLPWPCPFEAKSSRAYSTTIASLPRRIYDLSWAIWALSWICRVLFVIQSYNIALRRAEFFDIWTTRSYHRYFFSAITIRRILFTYDGATKAWEATPNLARSDINLPLFCRHVLFKTQSPFVWLRSCRHCYTTVTRLSVEWNPSRYQLNLSFDLENMYGGKSSTWACLRVDLKPPISINIQKPRLFRLCK